MLGVQIVQDWTQNATLRHPIVYGPIAFVLGPDGHHLASFTEVIFYQYSAACREAIHHNLVHSDRLLYTIKRCIEVQECPDTLFPVLYIEQPSLSRIN